MPTLTWKMKGKSLFGLLWAIWVHSSIIVWTSFGDFLILPAYSHIFQCHIINYIFVVWLITYEEKIGVIHALNQDNNPLPPRLFTLRKQKKQWLKKYLLSIHVRRHQIRNRKPWQIHAVIYSCTAAINILDMKSSRRHHHYVICYIYIIIEKTSIWCYRWLRIVCVHNYYII